MQVPEDLYLVLRNRGFMFNYRDETWVKGIGKVRTYFLTGCSVEAARRVGLDKAMSALGAVTGADGGLVLGDAAPSLANVVFSLCQSNNRKKRYGNTVEENEDV